MRTLWQTQGGKVVGSWRKAEVKEGYFSFLKIENKWVYLKDWFQRVNREEIGDTAMSLPMTQIPDKVGMVWEKGQTQDNTPLPLF